MKFKTYKAARNYLVTRIENAGVDVRDINLDRLMTETFIGRGIGDDFELDLLPHQDSFSATLRALRIPRRGTVSDKCWEAAMRRLGAYMGTYYAADDADALVVELRDRALFAQFMVEEAL